MNRNRLVGRYVFLFVAVGVSGGLLLHTSQNVQRKESELRSLLDALERERQTVEVLEAEWTHLNSPYRLEALVHEYLEMIPPGADRIMPDPGMLPVADGEPEIMARDVVLEAPAGVVGDEADGAAALAVPVAVSNVPKKKPVSPAPAKAQTASAPIQAPMVDAPAAKAVKSQEDDMSSLLGRLGGGQ